MRYLCYTIYNKNKIEGNDKSDEQTHKTSRYASDARRIINFVSRLRESG